MFVIAPQNQCLTAARLFAKAPMCKNSLNSFAQAPKLDILGARGCICGRSPRMFAIAAQNRCLTSAFVVAAAVSALAGPAGADPYYKYLQIPVTEWMRLPRFCWGQFNDELKGDEFWFRGCGVGVNHYCEGLLDLQRSKKTSNMNDKRIMITKARTNTLYTLDSMKRENTFASCSITQHIQQTMREIELESKIYQVK